MIVQMSVEAPSTGVDVLLYEEYREEKKEERS
jgi:hypothetical protein